MIDERTSLLLSWLEDEVFVPFGQQSGRSTVVHSRQCPHVRRARQYTTKPASVLDIDGETTRYCTICTGEAGHNDKGGIRPEPVRKAIAAVRSDDVATD